MASGFSCPSCAQPSILCHYKINTTIPCALVWQGGHNYAAELIIDCLSWTKETAQHVAIATEVQRHMHGGCSRMPCTKWNEEVTDTVQLWPEELTLPCCDRVDYVSVMSVQQHCTASVAGRQQRAPRHAYGWSAPCENCPPCQCR
jgi:hypothetical protein